MAQLVHLHLRGNTGGEQRVLPVVFAFLIGERVLGAGEHGLALPIARLQCLNLKTRTCQARLRFLRRDAKWRVIDPKKHRTLFHKLVVAHVDLAHAAGNIGADDHLRGFDVGVIGRLITAAG